MHDIYYYFGFLFIFVSIIDIFLAKYRTKKDKKSLEEGDNVINESLETGTAKGYWSWVWKTIFNLRGFYSLIATIWEIIGFWTPQWHYFIFGWVASITLFIIGVVGLRKFPDKKQVELTIATMILNIIIFSLIIYNHFYIEHL